MKEFYFDPINEGEVATYVISFIPINNILTTMDIYIKFPDTFDQRLGNTVEIFILSGLKGDIKTSIVDHTIVITNFDEYSVSPDNPIKVEVTGVINPNKPFVGHSGYISVGSIIRGNNKFEDYLEQAAVIETVSSAGWLSLNNVVPSNTKARTSADYFFNVTLSDAVPRTDYEGKVFVQLPSEFEIESGIVLCKNNTANLGLNTVCEREKRVIALSGHTQELSS